MADLEIRYFNDGKEKYQSQEAHISLHNVDGTGHYTLDLSSYGEDMVETHTNLRLRLQDLITRLQAVVDGDLGPTTGKVS